MFQKGDLVVLRATGEIGICTENEEQSVQHNLLKLKQYRAELKQARLDGHNDLIQYLADKVYNYYLLVMKDKDKDKEK